MDEPKDKDPDIEKYIPLVKVVTRKFLSTVTSEQDLFQEGMIALFRAIKTFKEDGGAKFETYASRCIQNRLIDVLRKQAAKIEDGSELHEGDAMTALSLEEEIDLIERNDIIKNVLIQCTDIERAVFNSYRQGYSYQEIGKIFDLTSKKIDNILQKIKNKIKQAASD